MIPRQAVRGLQRAAQDAGLRLVRGSGMGHPPRRVLGVRTAILAAALTIPLSVSCQPSGEAPKRAAPAEWLVTLYACDGTPIRTWTTDRVAWDGGTCWVGGYRYGDPAVHGTVTVERIRESGP
jgi:hypothetical protein